MGHERPIGCLTMIWIASAMKFDEAVRTHKDALIAAAGAISREARLSAETSASCQGSQPDGVEQLSGIAVAPKESLLVAVDHKRSHKRNPCAKVAR
jgi:hypothetical protein